MKRYLPFFTLALSCLVGFVSCDNDETESIVVSTPALTVSSGITVSYKGGDYSFLYTLTDPDEDGEVSSYAEVSWISDLDVSSAGKVAFSARENISDQIRGGNIVLVYTYPEGRVTKRVGVVQSAYGAPTLVLNESVLTVADGSGTYSFTYTVEDPVDDAELTCTANVDWIVDPDCSASGTVQFDVTANRTEELRSGEMTLTYSYSTGAVSGTVVVVQDHPDKNSVDISELIGTYEASGEAYVSAAHAEPITWTMRIFASDDGKSLVIDGMVPYAQGCHDDLPAALATGAVNLAGQLVVPSQFTGYYETSSGYQFGYTPCIQYIDGRGFSYDKTGPDCTFTYYADSDTWVSDYGMFLALFGTYGDFSTLMRSLDIVTPSITLKKVSENPNALSVEGTPMRNGLNIQFEPNQP
ncbi:MAG: hypothetical protein LUD72_01205 [Bacteroidales bacterium]|nr:hypothetical protein [Bacteroidales bacterium]